MKIYRLFPRFNLTIFALFLAFGCEQKAIDPSRKIRITNDAGSLNNRLTERADTLEVEYTSSAASKGRQSLELIVRLELDPPAVEAQSLQASSVTERGNKVLVTYNFAGEPYRGGIDYLAYKGFKKKPDELKILSQILFNDTDIHNADCRGSELFVAGASEVSVPPAYVHSFKVTGNAIKQDQGNYVSLGSYAANSVSETEGAIYVTTGDDATAGGGLYQLDKDLNVVKSMALHDARWVKAANNKLFVGQGTPGQITIIDATDFSVLRQIPVDGAKVAQAKTTLDLADGMIFFAAGRQGVFVFDEQTGRELHHITFPEANSITNAVSVDEGMIFISNGEGGIYIASYSPDKTAAPQLIGKLSVENSVSVNHIVYRDDILYVAAGIGGVKVVKVVR